jgi:hypothetical protein
VRGVVRSRQSSVTGSNENLEVRIFYHENIKGIFSVPDPVYGAFLTPGSGMGKKSGSGPWWKKIGSGMEKIRIRDKHPW